MKQSDIQSVSLRESVESLGLVWSDELAQKIENVDVLELGRQLSRFLSRDMARDLWIEWNPDQSQRVEDKQFLEHFWKFLADGVGLGYRLERFREASASLPDPDADAKNWISIFEQVIDCPDCCKFRVYLSREQEQEFRQTRVRDPDYPDDWLKLLEMMADGLFYEIGIVYEPLTIQVDDNLESPWIRCEWNDLKLPPNKGLDNEHLLVNDTVDRLTLLNIKGEEAINPANGSECATIDIAYREIAETAGLTSWDSQGYAIILMAAYVRRAAAALVNRSFYFLYKYRLRETWPELVSAVESALDQDFLIQILRRLLAEEISIRDMSSVLEAAMELRTSYQVDSGRYIVFTPPTGGVYPTTVEKSAADLTPADYVEYIRAQLKRYISHKYTRGGNTLVVYLMDRDFEDVFAHSESIDPEFEAGIMQAVRDEVGHLPPTAQNPVILTNMEIRHRLRNLVSAEFPNLAVVSYQELSPDMNIQPIARISPEIALA